MTPTEKLMSHLKNILPRLDWEQQKMAITGMVSDVYDEGFADAEVTIETTEATK